MRLYKRRIYAIDLSNSRPPTLWRTTARINRFSRTSPIPFIFFIVFFPTFLVSRTLFRCIWRGKDRRESSNRRRLRKPITRFLHRLAGNREERSIPITFDSFPTRQVDLIVSFILSNSVFCFLKLFFHKLRSSHETVHRIGGCFLPSFFFFFLLSNTTRFTLAQIFFHAKLNRYTHTNAKRKF